MRNRADVAANRLPLRTRVFTTVLDRFGRCVYRPSASREPPPVVVYFHGGGWVLGSNRMYDPLCTFLARAVEAVVVSVDYRMAPEHRAPIAVHDCVDAVRWLGEHADSFAGNASRLAVSGDSAGGNLSAIVCQVVRDEGGPTISHQALLYPATDATKSQPSVVEHAGGPMLTVAKIDAFLDLYLGPDGLAATDPLVSPLWAANHADLPPALVQTADLDPLRDEGRLYAELLAAAGVSVRHQLCRCAARVRQLPRGDDHRPTAPRGAGLRAASPPAPLTPPYSHRSRLVSTTMCRRASGLSVHEIPQSAPDPVGDRGIRWGDRGRGPPVNHR